MSDQAAPGRPPRQSFFAELVDAISTRTFLLVVGVLVIQLAFVFSYVGAFHHPTPHRIPIAVTAPPPAPPAAAREAAARLNRIAGRPLQASAVTAAKGDTLLRDGATDGVLVIDANSATDTLLVASGQGAAVVTAVESVIDQVEAAAHRTVRVFDKVPAQAGDARGLTGFYLVIGWLIGGYLAAALLSIAHGARPATARRAGIRLLSMVPYALLSGLGGALIVGPLLGALTGHLLAILLLGALLTFTAAAVTMAFQVIAGVLGIGLTVVLFVVLGNPSAGGAYQAPLLPGFWRVITPYIPNGAGVSALRQIVYFGAHGIAGHLVLIAAYALVGTCVALGVAGARSSGEGAAVPEPAD